MTIKAEMIATAGFRRWLGEIMPELPRLHENELWDAEDMWTPYGEEAVSLKALELARNCYRLYCAGNLDAAEIALRAAIELIK